MNNKFQYNLLKVTTFILGGLGIYFQFLFLQPLFPQLINLSDKGNSGIDNFILGLVFAVLAVLVHFRKNRLAGQLTAENDDSIRTNELLYNTRVDPWIATVLGSVLCSIIYLTIFSFDPDLDSEFTSFNLLLRQKLSNRGIIPFIAALFFSIVAVICFLKARHALGIRQSLRQTSNQYFSKQLTFAALGSRSDFIAKRMHLSQTLSNNRQEYFAELDREELATSFSFVQFLLWAIPVLGFIGTVWGISEGIGGFTNAFESSGTDGLNPKALNPSLAYLAIAFDTTLVALILGVIAMFISTFTRRFEEHLLLGYHLFLSKAVAEEDQPSADPVFTPLQPTAQTIGVAPQAQTHSDPATSQAEQLYADHAGQTPEHLASSTPDPESVAADLSHRVDQRPIVEAGEWETHDSGEEALDSPNEVTEAAADTQETNALFSESGDDQAKEETTPVEPGKTTEEFSPGRPVQAGSGEAFHSSTPENTLPDEDKE